MSVVLTDQGTIDRWKAVRQEELDAEAIYRALGRAESDPGRKALFEGIAIGAAITLLTGKSVLVSGFRQLAFGAAAFVVTYGIGALFGTAIG